MVAIDLTREDPITLDRAAAWLGKSRRTIDRWCQQGLEKFFLGGTPYTTKQAFIRFARPALDVAPQATYRSEPLDGSFLEPRSKQTELASGTHH